MQSKLGHLQFGIDGKNRAFYRDLFTCLGWKIMYDVDDMLAVVDSNHVSLWFTNATKQAANDYDGPGLNHLAIHTVTQADVDQAAAFLSEHGITHLFETPRHRPEFSQEPNSTYYQVMFETPDHILGEVVYIGPKQ